MGLSLLVGCGSNTTNQPKKDDISENETPAIEDADVVVNDYISPFVTLAEVDGIQIELSDTEVLVDGVSASNDESQAIYVANDIIYYEAGHDFTYGEGAESDAHSKEEADKHLVVHITQPGNYIVSGTLSAGQIAIDLGKESKEDPNAIVNLYLNGVNITSTVAPAVIFYNVYEPFNDVDETTATKDVDTSMAGANVYIVDNTENNVTGSHVARIYKPDSVVLSEDGTTVEDAKKLHKYDAAFYSKVTMNINGGVKEGGILNIKADNEGLDTEMHLTINGGFINIESGNDGINTNEDGISVTTINDGKLTILVNGSTGEGDGIDSNGWLVINGGVVISQACGFSMDSGIDSDMGIHINGGYVIATGNMLDRISESNQTYVVLSFNESLGEGRYSLKDSSGIPIVEVAITNSFTNLIFSSRNLVEGDYTFWFNDTQLVGAMGENGMMGGRPDFQIDGIPNGEMPEGMTPPDGFNGDGMRNPNGERPEGEVPNNEKPDGFDPNMRPNQDGSTPPDDFKINEDGTITLPDGTVVDPSEMGDRGQFKGQGEFSGNMPMELSEIFTIKVGENYFSSISVKG